ncbi:MAG: acetyl-CoA hydrolase/transferase C-terminal domain-containing protein [Tetrasphaera sp.]
MVDLRQFLTAGSGLWWSQTSAEPTVLVRALLDQVADIGPVRAFVGMTWDPAIGSELPEEISVLSYGGLGRLQALSAEGRLDVLACHFSSLPRLFADGHLPCDVGLVQVSPPDDDGNCSLGVGVDYVADAVEHTRVLIAEINQQMPPTTGSRRIPLSRFAATVETDRPLLTAPTTAVKPVDQRIAANVAALIEDGDTIQIGVGSLPAAVLATLRGHRDLGVHSGMIADGVLDLVETGVLTGARKEIDPGLIVTGAALGSSRLYHSLEQIPVEFRPVSYTHDPRVLSQLRSLVAINSAIEVDLTGQVGAERRAGVTVGAIGGQTDFSRAAALTGSRSIIALRSTARGSSTIKPTLEFGAVTTSRADVDFVVTEHGVAKLTGCPISERPHRVIEVADPAHREALAAQLRTQRFEPSANTALH